MSKDDPSEFTMKRSDEQLGAFCDSSRASYRAENTLLDHSEIDDPESSETSLASSGMKEAPETRSAESVSRHASAALFRAEAFLNNVRTEVFMQFNAIRDGVSTGFENPSTIPALIDSAITAIANTGRTEVLLWTIVLYVLWSLFKVVAQIALDRIEMILSLFGISLYGLVGLPSSFAHFGYRVCIAGLPAIGNIVIICLAAGFFCSLFYQLALRLKYANLENSAIYSPPSTDSHQTPRQSPRLVNGHFVKPPGAAYVKVSPKVRRDTEESERLSRTRSYSGVIEWHGDTPACHEICGKLAYDCHHYKQLANDLLLEENKGIEQMRQHHMGMKRKENEHRLEIRGLKEEQEAMQRRIIALQSELASTKEQLEVSNELAGSESRALYDNLKHEIEENNKVAVAVREESEGTIEGLVVEFERFYKHEQKLQEWINDANLEAEVIVATLTRKLLQAYDEVHEMPLIQAQLQEYKEKYSRALQAQHHAMTRSRDAEERRQICYDRMKAAEERARIAEEHVADVRGKQALRETFRVTKKGVVELMNQAALAKKMREQAADDFFRA